MGHRFWVPLHSRPARCRPTADRRRPGRRTRSGPLGGRPGEDGGTNQGGGGPPPLPSPPRRTDPLAAHRAAPDARGRPATPTARVYPRGARRKQRMAGGRPTGRGGGGRWGGPPIPPPRSPPPAIGPQERPSTPPGAEGTPPLPQKGPRRGGGGGCGWTCTPRAPAPPAACSRGGRGRWAIPHLQPERPADQALGRRRTRTVWRPHPP